VIRGCSIVVWRDFTGTGKKEMCSWTCPGLWEWALKNNGHVCGEPAVGSDFLDGVEIFMCSKHYFQWFKGGKRKAVCGNG